jgi:hypothetical protein
MNQGVEKYKKYGGNEHTAGLDFSEYHSACSKIAD